MFVCKLYFLVIAKYFDFGNKTSIFIIINIKTICCFILYFCFQFFYIMI